MSRSNDVLGAQILSAGRILRAEHKGQTGFKFSRRRLVIKGQYSLDLSPRGRVSSRLECRLIREESDNYSQEGERRS